jgi:hypothetical protein
VEAASDNHFEFGFEGKPLLFPGPPDDDDLLDALSYEPAVIAGEMSELSE